ncbi:DUF6538 domain-containing protein [Paracoccus sp. (in: a-proteobacteria)]|uniref:DUF6538 domain-containing protein n=1 Tax=Paracoccus sp. TaxID=267 RepID=UPI003A83A128
MKRSTLILRGDHWYIRRRVPVRYAPVDPRTFVNLSLFTDSREVAEQKASQVWAEMIEAWEAALAGQEAAATARMAAARDLAQRRGYRYLSAENVATLPLDQLVARIEAVVDGRGHTDLQGGGGPAGRRTKAGHPRL